MFEGVAMTRRRSLRHHLLHDYHYYIIGKLREVQLATGWRQVAPNALLIDAHAHLNTHTGHQAEKHIVSAISEN